MMGDLYMYRPVAYATANMLAIISMKMGLKNLVYDPHVTVAYSEKEVDWNLPVFQPHFDIKHPAVKGLAALDNDAIVLELEDDYLYQRWAELVTAGASWEWPSYRPHITLGFDADFSVDAARIALPKTVEIQEERRETVK